MEDNKKDPKINPSDLNGTRHKSNAEYILKKIIVVILCFVIILVIFGTGFFIGQQKAMFSFQWAEDYHRNFGGPASGVFGNLPAQSFMSGHGIFGLVIQVDDKSLVIKGQDNMEKTVEVLTDTVIVKQTVQIKLSDIRVGNSVVIIGEPNEQGEINAKFIRVFPAGLPMPMTYYEYKINLQ